MSTENAKVQITPSQALEVLVQVAQHKLLTLNLAEHGLVQESLQVLKALVVSYEAERQIAKAAPELTVAPEKATVE